ncbi:ACP phosphodiesterase [Aureitalea marina]|uniref:ACP phosphodiesterase n=1 Tax=Aureitalea marina TaxID=930804 RepID=A0A2S7KTU8_9FLAO|nr:ACP phosphodiesterase [Aureitalea marina]PQB05953.1 ACP phosphodiesterase [Aureitalea marina]
MNFLAHIYLSGEEELVTLGNFMADGIKGRKYKDYSPQIQKGILLHRAIDTFTDAHPVVRQSTARLHASYSHYSGVIVDMFYDHFLASRWMEYHKQPLQDFVQEFYDLLHHRYDELTPRIQRLMPYMIADNWLLSYATIPGLEKILGQMDSRTAGKSRMQQSVNELQEFYEEFGSEFDLFFNELIIFSQSKLDQL